jgi:chromosome segregation ATPase
LTIETAFVGFVIVLLGTAGVVVQAIGRSAAAAALRASTQAEAAVKREEIFNGMVTDLRSEITTVRNEYREEVKRGNEQEIVIRQLLERLADLPKLERDIEKLRGEVAALVTELERVKEARIQRERELETERQAREKAEDKLTNMQTAFVKERGEWQIERARLNERIIEMQDQIDQLTPRMDFMEAKIKTNEVETVKPDEPPPGANEGKLIA